MKKELAAAALQKNPLPPAPNRWMPLGGLDQCTKMASECLDMVSDSTYAAEEVLRMAMEVADMEEEETIEYHSLKDQMQSAHF